MRWVFLGCREIPSSTARPPDVGDGAIPRPTDDWRLSRNLDGLLRMGTTRKRVLETFPFSSVAV